MKVILSIWLSIWTGMSEGKKIAIGLLLVGLLLAAAASMTVSLLPKLFLFGLGLLALIGAFCFFVAIVIYQFVFGAKV